jgi:hypothetical protein
LAPAPWSGSKCWRESGEARAQRNPQGPIIEEIESDSEHLERLMRHLLTTIQRDIQPLFARYPDFYVSVNVPPVMLGDGRIRTMIQELGLGRASTGWFAR